jgi:CRP-like cAMP-binding protein
MERISATDSDRLAKRIVAHHSFPGASHAAIERVLAMGELQGFDHGATLCAEGLLGDEIFFLVRGNITVLRKDGAGEDRILSDMTCPNVFGHMAVVDGSRRSATCRANGPVEVVVLPRRIVDRLVAEGSIAGIALRRLLIASLCDQLSNANGFVRKIVLDHADPRAARAHNKPSSPAAGRPTSPLGQTGRGMSQQEQDLRTLSAKLGGWETDFDGLGEYEREIKLVMDEDQKRTLDARRKN